MKTTKQTTLSNNPHEQPVHVLKRSMFFRCFAYFVATTIPIINCYLWWCLYFNPLPGLNTEPEYKIGMLALLVMASLICILLVAIVAAVGDIYFYERYVEIRRLLPFMKQHVIYYDKMHAHIPELAEFSDMMSFTLNRYETPPKVWKSPYTWLKAYHSESICFGHSKVTTFYDPEILEFVKTKAQSVNYHRF